MVAIVKTRGRIVGTYSGVPGRGKSFTNSRSRIRERSSTALRTRKSRRSIPSSTILGSSPSSWAPHSCHPGARSAYRGARALTWEHLHPGASPPTIKVLRSVRCGTKISEPRRTVSMSSESIVSKLSCKPAMRWSGLSGRIPFLFRALLVGRVGVASGSLPRSGILRPAARAEACTSVVPASVTARGRWRGWRVKRRVRQRDPSRRCRRGRRRRGCRRASRRRLR